MVGGLSQIYGVSQHQGWKAWDAQREAKSIYYPSGWSACYPTLGQQDKVLQMVSPEMKVDGMKTKPHTFCPVFRRTLKIIFAVGESQCWKKIGDITCPRGRSHKMIPHQSSGGHHLNKSNSDSHSQIHWESSTEPLRGGTSPNHRVAQSNSGSESTRTNSLPVSPIQNLESS